MEQLPFDSSVQAEYEDGYIHDETAFGDVSPYLPMWQEIQDDEGRWMWQQVGKNIFNDILEKRPEAHHGRMVRFSVFWKDQRYDIDWTTLPENARPIRFRDGSATMTAEGENKFNGYHACRFGYQYRDENGKNVKEVQEL